MKALRLPLIFAAIAALAADPDNTRLLRRSVAIGAVVSLVATNFEIIAWQGDQQWMVNEPLRSSAATLMGQVAEFFAPLLNS